MLVILAGKLLSSASAMWVMLKASMWAWKQENISRERRNISKGECLQEKDQCLPREGVELTGNSYNHVLVKTSRHKSKTKGALICYTGVCVDLYLLFWKLNECSLGHKTFDKQE